MTAQELHVRPQLSEKHQQFNDALSSSRRLIRAKEIFTRNLDREPQWSALPIFHLLVQSLGSSSEKLSLSGEIKHKFAGLLTAFGLYETTDGKDTQVQHVAGQEFDEDRDKTKYADVLKSSQVRIAIAKAADMGIHSEDRFVRASENNKYLEEKFGLSVEQHNEQSLRFLNIRHGNDVMETLIQNGQETPMFKPKDVDKSRPEYEQRQVVFQLLMDTVSSNTITENEGKFQIALDSATSLYEGRTDTGVVKNERALFECTAISQNVLEGIVFGLRDEKHPVSAEVGQQFWNVFYGDFFKRYGKYPQDRPPEQRLQWLQFHKDWYLQRVEEFGWSPDQGLKIQFLREVNGGFKIDHPLFIHFAVTAVNGIQKHDNNTANAEVRPEFEEECRHAILLAKGYPLDMDVLLQKLIGRILDKLEYESQGEKEVPYEDGVRPLNDVVAEMKQAGLPVPGDLFEIIPRDKSERLKVLREQRDFLRKLEKQRKYFVA